MAGEFNLGHSKLQEEKLVAWRKKQITGDLNEVPNVGPATIKTLNSLGIYNTFQLIGDMLKHVDKPFTDEASIRKFGKIYWDRMVNTFKSPAGHAHTVVHALIEKVSDGFNVPGVKIPKSRISEVAMLEWKSKFPKNAAGQYVLDYDVTAFKWVGPEIAKSLRTAGQDGKDNIENSWQFIGLFLEFYTNGSAEDLAAYSEKMRNYGKGVQPLAYAAQILELLSVGIAVKEVVDPIPMASFDDATEEASGGGTYQRPNAGGRVSSSASSTSARPSSKTKEKAPKKGSGVQSTIIMAIILFLLLLFIKNKLGL